MNSLFFSFLFGCQETSKASEHMSSETAPEPTEPSSETETESSEEPEIADEDNPENSQEASEELPEEPSEETTDTGEIEELPEQEALAIVGYYVQDMDGSYHNITPNVWEINFGAGEIYSYQIRHYNNQQGWIIAENDANTPSETGKWSRFDYRQNRAGDLTVCQSTSQADDELEALNWPPSIPGQGCTGWGWLTLTLFENL